ncbi:hypothetical protein GC197_14675 [bacterium]|nr:hypothetical protein [bacterium]
MKSTRLLSAILLLVPCLGCSMSDALFTVFGDHYSGGGSTRAEKEYDYNQRVNAGGDYDSSYP